MDLNGARYLQIALQSDTFVIVLRFLAAFHLIDGPFLFLLP